MAKSKQNSIHQTYKINASPTKVFNALTNAKTIEMWSGSEAIMDAKTGTKFKLWGGDMFGENVEVVKNKKLVQQWNTKQFESKVTFTLTPKGKQTQVDLVHENIPEKHIKDYAQGWKDYYLGAIQSMFEG
ncbi:MAG: SRPBCC domain-containing protein [Bacteroidetes bacterium]|nr:SRPBCC domain-containing protein [Bacteroidota bacterium]